MTNYATISDVSLLWREPADEAETALINALLTAVSSEIRVYADNVGKDFDSMIEDNADLAEVAKSVVVDVVRRYVNDNASSLPSMSQMSQSAGGYSVSGTFLVPGGGLFIKKNEYARLGLRRQRAGVIDIG